MKAGDNIVIDFNNTNTAPFRQHGVLRSEDDEWVRVEGTVGEDIGKTIMVPKSNIKRIVVL